MKRRVAVVLFSVSVLVALFATYPSARADRGYLHVVRPGETLASIAQRYYGDPRRESVLVAENGLTAQGGAAIVVGLRLSVPWVGYHRVAPGETWPELAERFFGDSRRAHVLLEVNGGTSGEQPHEGAELIIPYPLRHVAGQSDNVPRLSKLYYGSNEHSRKLRRFNNLRSNRLTRGQIVLIPLADLVLAEEGRRIIERETGAAPPAGEMRALQARITAELPVLREHVRRGRYTEAVALGNRLLGAEVLTGNQVVTIRRELGTAFVALGREDLAVESFAAALERQPDLELDGLRTSPTVLTAFQSARDANLDPDAGVSDAGVDSGDAAPDAAP